MKVACPLAVIVLFLLPRLSAELVREETSYRFSLDGLSVCLDARTGACTAIAVNGRILLGTATGVRPAVRLRQDDQWLPARPEDCHLENVEELSPGKLVVRFSFGEWQVSENYTLDAKMRRIRRRITVGWSGADETRLKGLAMPVPLLPSDSYQRWFSPGCWPPAMREAGEYTPGYRRSFSHFPQPLIVQLDSSCSIVFVSDPMTAHSDEGNISVTEGAEGLEIAPAFDAFARMKPGAVQVVGDSWLWVVDGDAESALGALHGFYAELGFTIPGDRTDWLKSAILYSFHPGGTIGSGFHDLGGFVPAARALDGIADLGCNAIWIMPVEDAGVYHPRDYYRFQQGLGTADEFRALISRAHQLGMGVLQDIVPHGGRNDYPRAKEHPEWLVQNEDGSTLSYWCFDFNWPEWRAYMAAVARYYVSEFDVDGYRVDACSGSKIPNWNPEIPYGRASFARLQGGVNMLSGLRQAVRQIKPDRGAILAESGSPVSGTVSDAIYDFSFCYQVLHDIRRGPAETVVPQLRRWLHEQALAGPRDLLRLRHIESHDSLRSLLWYGLDPQRALLALSTLIPGIPLVYHEQEIGSRLAFQRLFAIRRALPELCGGAADFLSVECPPGIFACLRSTEDAASIVLINLDPAIDGTEPVRVALPPATLPKGVRERAGDLWDSIGLTIPFTAERDQDRVVFSVCLEPFNYAIIRSSPIMAGLKDLPSRPSGLPEWRSSAGSSEVRSRPAGKWTIQAADMELDLDETTGLPKEWRLHGIRCGSAWDLYLPVEQKPGGPAVLTGDPLRGVVSRREYGSHVLEVNYTPLADGIQVKANWCDGGVPECASLSVPFISARRWLAEAGEGIFEDIYEGAKHPAGDGFSGSIYRHRQGTSVLWDSLVHPFLPGLPAGVAVLTGAGPLHLAFTARQNPDTEDAGALVSPGGFQADPVPVRVRWLEREGDQDQLSACVAWNDRDFLQTGYPELCLHLCPGSLSETSAVSAGRPNRPEESRNYTFRAVAGGWLFSNPFYALRLSRSGVITELRDLRAGRVVIRDGDLYTDAGFAPARDRYAAANDVEAYARFENEGDELSLSFQGCLRGFHRFDKRGTAVEYQICYRVGETGSFGMFWAVKPHGAPQGERAFLSLFLPVPGMHAFLFSGGGSKDIRGDIGDGSVRVGETAKLAEPFIPDTIVVSGSSGVLYRLTALTCCEGVIENIFAHGEKLFLAFRDGSCLRGYPGTWQGVEAVVTPGEAEPTAIPRGKFAGYGSVDSQREAVLLDGGFEMGGLLPVSVMKGARLPTEMSETGWLAPQGGTITDNQPRSGGLSAEVEGAKGNYRLWRQILPAAVFPAGSKWLLSAWVKGENIEAGDISWQVGTVRIAEMLQTTRYHSCEPLVGTFDWKRVEVEWTVPDTLQGVEVQVGQNGASGRLWVDDVSLEKK